MEITKARNQVTEKTKNNRIVWLRTNEKKVEYERNLRGELEATTNNTDENKTIEETWGRIKAKLEVTAKKCIKETKKEKKESFDEECKRELQSRRKLRLKMLQEGTEEAKNKFEEQRRETKMMLRNKKRKHYEKVLEQIEENNRNNDIRHLYQGVKNEDERRGYQPKPVFYKDKDGKIIAGDGEILERWK
ncbi:hypothetical protein NQ315_016676 [Exocentrus adspersus]|uniref:Uncharacterized protein n=1 Tax=Exocentrus adspersus TaxID=1586481 RepID=A0AAV8VP63_9CUCU|nr:hypothetical protein NQ315_016676 [Exocentrus adspersus]